MSQKFSMLFSQLESDLPAILAWSQSHPLEDQVYCYSHQTSSTLFPKKIWSGSSGLVYLGRLLDRLIPRPDGKPFTPEWTPTDTDIYELGCRQNYVNQDKPTRTDHVQVEYQTVPELLLDFDLPCCRAAYDENGNVWVSAQCLLALTTGEYFLPAFLSQRNSFVLALRSTKRLEGHPNLRDVEDFCYRRYLTRIKKYADRGFRPILIETTQLPSWLSRNFFGSSTWSS